jgi:hypothetical protein
VRLATQIDPFQLNIDSAPVILLLLGAVLLLSGTAFAILQKDGQTNEFKMPTAGHRA